MARRDILLYLAANISRAWGIAGIEEYLEPKVIGWRQWNGHLTASEARELLGAYDRGLQNASQSRDLPCHSHS